LTNDQRERIATAAMQAIIADPNDLEKEEIVCPSCFGSKKHMVASDMCIECDTCKGSGKVLADCETSVAIKAVRYAEALGKQLDCAYQI